MIGHERRLAITLLAAGCSSSKTIAHVTVTVTDPSGAPIENAHVYLTDLAGHADSVFTDSTGSVAAQVEAGGAVWINRFPSDSNEGADFTAFADVQDGDAVVFGSSHRASPGFVASMTIVAAPPSPPPNGRVTILSTCGQMDFNNATKLSFEARCNGVADLLVDSDDNSGGTQMYAFLPAQPIVDGGTITVPPTAWHALDTVSVQLSGADVGGGEIRNEFGVSAHATMTGQTLAGSLPLVGSHLELFAAVNSPTINQALVDLPVQATQTVDLAHAVLPSVTMTRDPPIAWSVDDASRLTGAEMAVTSYGWQLPSPTGGAVIHVHAYATAPEPGAIPDMVGPMIVPDPRYLPADQLIDKRLALMRFGPALDSKDILANIDEFALSLMTRSSYPFLPGPSVAFSGLP